MDNLQHNDELSRLMFDMYKKGSLSRGNRCHPLQDKSLSELTLDLVNGAVEIDKTTYDGHHTLTVEDAAKLKFCVNILTGFLKNTENVDDKLSTVSKLNTKECTQMCIVKPTKRKQEADKLERSLKKFRDSLELSQQKRRIPVIEPVLKRRGRPKGVKNGQGQSSKCMATSNGQKTTEPTQNALETLDQLEG